MVEVGCAGYLRHVFLTGVHQIEVQLLLRRRRPHSEHAVLGVIDELATFGYELGNQLGDADAEVNVGTVGYILGCPRCHLFSRPTGAHG